MSSWMSDAAAAAPNQHGNSFPHPSANSNVMDPTALMTNQMHFDPQFANQQHFAGAMRNPSPSVHNPMYQTNPVIPSKRPRPRGDSIGQSPLPAPGTLPNSRSATPQQPQYAAFQQPGMPQSQPQPPHQQQHQQHQPSQQSIPQQAAHSQPHLHHQPQPAQPSPYQHLQQQPQQNGSANATPSPVMANQRRPGSVPQRVATMSPHPFSPAAGQQPHAQASPIPSEHNTPQPNSFMQPGNFAPTFNPQLNPSQSPGRPSMSPNPMAQAGAPAMGQMPPSQMSGGAMAAGQMPNPMFPQQQKARVDPKLLYQMQLQQIQRGNMQILPQGPPQNMPQMHQAQAQAQASSRNMMARQHGMNGQMTTRPMRSQMDMPQQQLAMPRWPSIDHFLNHLSSFMASKQLHLEATPTIEGRTVNLMFLFQAVARLHGYRNVTPHGWQQVSQAVGFPPGHFTTAPQHLKSIYEQSLYRFEEALTMQNRAKMVQQQQQQQQQQQHHHQLQSQPQQPQQQYHHQQQQQMQYPTPQQLQQPQSQQPQQQQQQSQLPLPQQHVQALYQPYKNLHAPQLPPQQQPGMPRALHMQESPVKVPAQHQMPPETNMPGGHGHVPPAPPGIMMPSPAAKRAGSKQASVDLTPPQQFPPHTANMGLSHDSHSPSPSGGGVAPGVGADEFQLASPSPSKAGGMIIPGRIQPNGSIAIPESRNPFAPDADSDEYTPCSRPQVTHGGVDLKATIITSQELERWKPDIPPANELGNIDIQALIKSIQCGIRGEVRMALDTLATISSYTQPHLLLELELCDDLVETLVECAEEQVDKLVEGTAEVSDEILISAYEDVARACRIEALTLRDVPLFGSPEYKLDRCVDQLICITTILRNLSFVPKNDESLANEVVVHFLCTVFRYLGTRNMLLRTHANTLDFMKDAIVLLSNIAGWTEITGREQVLCLLSFLLAFAPTPAPSMVNDQLFFTPYEPGLHPYLPHAVDSLAKLFARDVPNRTHFRQVFAVDAAAAPLLVQQLPSDLLTRTFALAIAPIPDQSRDPRPPGFPSVAESRKPFLMQGLLAADILASLAPDHESGVTRAWLSMGNGFAQNLYRLVRYLCTQFEGTSARAVNGAQPRAHHMKDTDLVYIVKLAISMLRKVCEKARDPADPRGPLSIPPKILPTQDSLLGALQMASSEWSKEGMLSDLLAFASLED